MDNYINIKIDSNGFVVENKVSKFFYDIKGDNEDIVCTIKKVYKNMIKY